MVNGRRWICALLAIAALLFIPRMGRALEAASFSCSPAAGETVLPGDIVDYTLTIGQSGAADQWTALRIRLGEGMLIDKDSATVLPFAQPEASVRPEASVQPEAKTTPDLSAAQTEESPAEYEIVPGNDGFVVLFSSLRAGDEVSFCARVDSAQADVSAYAQTEGFAVSVSHKLGALPQASVLPAEDDAAIQAGGQADGAGAVRWALAVLCFVALCGIAIIAWRRFGGPLKQIRIRLPWQKEKTAVCTAMDDLNTSIIGEPIPAEVDEQIEEHADTAETKTPMPLE